MAENENRNYFILILLILVASILGFNNKSFLYSEEIRISKYCGVHFITEINENNVNVRAAPSIEANIITTLNAGHKVRITGVSKTNEKNDGYSGYWYRIEILDFKNTELYPLGKWVFSKYIKDKNFSPSKIHLKKLMKY